MSFSVREIGLALTSPTTGGLSFGIVRSRIKTTDFFNRCYLSSSVREIKLALTSPTSGGCSVGIVCLRIQATEFKFF
jgi:hypothetical protein